MSMYEHTYYLYSLSVMLESRFSQYVIAVIIDGIDAVLSLWWTVSYCVALSLH